MRTLVTALLLLAGIAGCNGQPTSQVAPIGSHCGSPLDCGPRPFDCATSLPGGYCTQACATDGDCPQDAVCVARQCRRRGKAPTDCRLTEGYTGRARGATQPGGDATDAPVVTDMTP
jgi:hypothetical protein